MTGNIELKQKFLEYYRQLPVLKLAGASIGKSDDTITRWKEEDAEFAEKIEAARAEFAMTNVKKVKSKEWLLERLMKDNFAQRTEITGKDGENLLPTPILGGKTVDALPANDSNS